MKTKKTFNILSIDGGGVRGIISLIILKKIFEELNNNKKNIKYTVPSAFDLVSGTSTGGIIALALTAAKKKGKNYKKDVLDPNYSIEDILEIYMNKSPKIFYQNVFKPLRKIRQIFMAKYSKRRLMKFAQEIYDNRTVKDSLTSLLVSVFNVKKNVPMFVKKRPDYYDWNTDPDFYIKDVAVATSSAPTYFSPFKLQPINSNEKYLSIDGGVFANNPSLFAFIEAVKITNNEHKKINLISIGTGTNEKNYSVTQCRPWGIGDYFSPFNNVPLLDIMFAGQRISSNHILENMPKLNQVRLDIDLENERLPIDDASKEGIDKLVKFANNYIEKNKDKIDQVVKILK